MFLKESNLRNYDFRRFSQKFDTFQPTCTGHLVATTTDSMERTKYNLTNCTQFVPNVDVYNEI